MGEVNSFETLTGYLSERFEAIDKRFDAMDHRFDAMDERLKKVETIVSDMPTKLYVRQSLAETEIAISNTIKVVQSRHDYLVDILKKDGSITDVHYREIKELPTIA